MPPKDVPSSLITDGGPDNNGQNTLTENRSPSNSPASASGHVTWKEVNENENTTNDPIASIVTAVRVTRTSVLELEPAENGEQNQHNDSQQPNSAAGRRYRQYKMERRKRDYLAASYHRCTGDQHIRSEDRFKEIAQSGIGPGPGRQSHHKHRVVRFDTHDEIIEIPSIYEMDQQEIRNMWYTEQYLLTMGQIQSLGEDDDDVEEEDRDEVVREETIGGGASCSRNHRSTSDVTWESINEVVTANRKSKMGQQQQNSFHILQDGWV